MPGSAKVQSLEAIEQFRASLIVYREKARAALDEADEEVRRLRQRLAGELPGRWERERRLRQRLLEQREQELFTARLSAFEADASARRQAVARARRAVEEAEEKLRAIRGWNRQFDSRVEPLHRRATRLRQWLGEGLEQGIQLLGRIIQTLSAYAERSAPVTGPGAPAGGTPATTDPEGSAGRADSEGSSQEEEA
ncbi:MAG: hypothetical protein D6766_12030 [Verrucomicrobia bacterium]|nr:MAG: hypothetical protein D6766_12030 [Verrucomicrobiota bacterium]